MFRRVITGGQEVASLGIDRGSGDFDGRSGCVNIMLYMVYSNI